MKHGGDLISYQDGYQGQLIDFSSNINALGPPKGLEEALIKGFPSLESYPDIQYRELKNTISQYLKVETSNVLVGNGAMELIDAACILAKRVVVVNPSFCEYTIRPLVHGKEVLGISYNEDFSINIGQLRKELKEEDLLILGNPNNPTGLRIPKEDLCEIYELVRELGAYLLLDEAFYEFVPEDYDTIELFKEYAYKNIGIIRAATKFFALPGIRLGYGCFNIEDVKKLEGVLMSWSVNALADIAGNFILKDKAYIEESKKLIQEERAYIYTNLLNLDGIKVYETHTNYILVKLLNTDENYLFDQLLKHGIVIRKCSSFKNLDNTYVRFAIKSRQDNEKLIEALKEIKL